MFCRFICSISFCCHGKSLIRQRRRNKSGPCGWICGDCLVDYFILYHRISRYITVCPSCYPLINRFDVGPSCWNFCNVYFRALVLLLWLMQARSLSGSREWLVGRPFEEITDRLSWVTQGGRFVCFVVWKLLRKSSATCSELTRCSSL